MRRFNPENDAIDKRILYEITGRKGAFEKYSDEGSSSDEESEDQRATYGEQIRENLLRRTESLTVD
jgi:hypothetical protein